MKLLIALVLVAAASAATATEAARQIVITQIAAVSANRPAAPTTPGYFRVYATPSAWGATNCRTDAADVSMNDWHLYATLLAAWRAGKTVSVTVESTLKIDVADNACQITAALVF